MFAGARQTTRAVADRRDRRDGVVAWGGCGSVVDIDVSVDVKAVRALSAVTDRARTPQKCRGSPIEGSSVDREHAAARDAEDPLAGLRAAFALPEGEICLDGNSLGPLQGAVATRLRAVSETEWGRGRIRGRPRRRCRDGLGSVPLRRGPGGRPGRLERGSRGRLHLHVHERWSRRTGLPLSRLPVARADRDAGARLVRPCPALRVRPLVRAGSRGTAVPRRNTSGALDGRTGDRPGGLRRCRSGDAGGACWRAHRPLHRARRRARRLGFTPLYVTRVEVVDAVGHLADLLATGDWDRPEFRRPRRVS